MITGNYLLASIEISSHIFLVIGNERSRSAPSSIWGVRVAILEIVFFLKYIHLTLGHSGSYIYAGNVGIQPHNVFGLECCTICISNQALKMCMHTLLSFNTKASEALQISFGEGKDLLLFTIVCLDNIQISIWFHGLPIVLYLPHT